MEFKDDSGKIVKVGDEVIDYWNGLDGVDSRGDTSTIVKIKNKNELIDVFRDKDSSGRVCKIINIDTKKMKKKKGVKLNNKVIDGQKMICPKCGKKSNTVAKRRMNTAYIEEQKNYIISCKECFDKGEEQWDYMWKTRNNHRL